MPEVPIRSGNEIIDSVFDFCVRLLIWGADLLGISYNTINVWIFCVLWPLFTLLLCLIVIWQHLQIRSLHRKANHARV